MGRDLEGGASEWYRWNLYPAPAIAARLRGLGIPTPRVVVGVGCGRTRSVGLVRDGVSHLRSAAPDLRVAVGGIGPNMLALGAVAADAVVVSMLALSRASEVHRTMLTAASGRRPPPTYAYHRVATPTADGARLLHQEMVALGVWPAAGPPPQPHDLPGSLAAGAAQLAATLAEYPDSWRPVLRPITADLADRDELVEMFHRYAPNPSGCAVEAERPVS